MASLFRALRKLLSSSLFAFSSNLFGSFYSGGVFSNLFNHGGVYRLFYDCFFSSVVAGGESNEGQGAQKKAYFFHFGFWFLIV